MPLTENQLPNGLEYCFDSAGHRICRGAQLGRSNTLPEDRKAPIKLYLIRLRWRDGDYDAGGAYWGNMQDGSHIWWAKSGDTSLFVRASTRTEAKRLVRIHLPNATFYR